MRFTKQLTACLATIGAVFFASAALSACDPDPQAAADGKKNQDFWQGLLDSGISTESAMGAADAAVLGLFGDFKQINGEPCADVTINAEEFPFPSYTKFMTTGWFAAHRQAETALGDSILGKFILGETQDGKTMKIYCNPGNCTVGSLNRFSVLTGAPMMVPAVLLDIVKKQKTQGVKLDDSGVWKTLASVIWSEAESKKTTYNNEMVKLEGDVNVIRAKAIYDADPTAYKSKRLAFIKSAHIENKVGVLITKGFDSTAEAIVVSTTDDAVVVTETVVTCTSDGQTNCVDAHDM